MNETLKYSLKLEELAMFLVGLYALHLTGAILPTWVYFLLFFAPDLGMLGYLVNSNFGAMTYNLFHHKGIALLVFMAGLWNMNELLLTSGALLFAHSSFDRILGYGLKYPDNFKHTHLGQL